MYQLFVIIKANPQPVGSAAGVGKAFAMLKLTIELQLSYRQVERAIVFLLMLFYSR